MTGVVCYGIEKLESGSYTVSVKGPDGLPCQEVYTTWALLVARLAGIAHEQGIGKSA